MLMTVVPGTLLRNDDGSGIPGVNQKLIVVRCETWAMRAELESKIDRSEMRMTRWMHQCFPERNTAAILHNISGVVVKYKISNLALLQSDKHVSYMSE